jgi:O-antigen/teichoic acid export membrane protein
MRRSRILPTRTATATLLVGAGTVAYSAGQWVLLIILARLATPSAVGEYALALGIATPLTLVFNLGLRQAQAVDSSGARLRDYLHLRIATGLVAGATIVTGCVASGVGFRLAAAIAAAKFVEGIGDVLLGSFQRTENFGAAATGQAMRASAGLIIAASTLHATKNVALAIALSAAAQAASIVAFDIPRAGGARFAVGFPVVRRSQNIAAILRVGLASAPLAVGAMLAAISTHLPRYFLASVATHADVGVYAVLTSLVIGFNIVVNSAGQAISPRLARLFRDGDRQSFARLSVLAASSCASVGLVLGLIGQVVGVPLVGWMFGEAYAAHTAAISTLFLILPISSAASILNYALVATNRFSLPPIAAACQTVAVLCASATCVHTLGVVGAIWSWSIGYAVQAVTIALLLRSALAGSDQSVQSRLHPGDATA